MTDPDFSPPHFPVTIEPVSMLEQNVLLKYLPHASAGIILLGYNLAAIAGPVTPAQEYGTSMLAGAMYTAGALGGLLSAFAYAADREISKHSNRIELTERGFIITEFHTEKGQIAQTTIDPTGYKAGVYMPSKNGPYMVTFMPEKGGQTIAIATPLEYGEAFQVAEMLNDAIDYFSAPYHLREEVKRRAIADFAARWDGNIPAPGPA